MGLSFLQQKKQEETRVKLLYEDYQSWLCPYCDHRAVRDLMEINKTSVYVELPNNAGMSEVETDIYHCPNPKCRELVIVCTHFLVKEFATGMYNPVEIIKSYPLKPTFTHRKYDGVVPEYIYEDYIEACAIRKLSPKASATLCRRCLQTIIHDYYKIQGKNLSDELDLVAALVSKQVHDAMDALRHCGNIGAHLKLADGLLGQNLTANEAKAMIDALELLIEDAYVAQRDRDAKLNHVISIAVEKKSRSKGK